MTRKMVAVRTPNHLAAAKSAKTRNLCMGFILGQLMALIPFFVIFLRYQAPNDTSQNYASSLSPLQSQLEEFLHPSQTMRQTKSGDKQKNGATSGYKLNFLLRHLNFNADSVYQALIRNHPNPGGNNYVVDVGAFRLGQSINAATQGFAVLSVDASPNNFAKMKEQHEKLSPEVKSLIKLQHNAVSAKSGETLMFSAIGGTGDHISNVNIDAGQAKYDRKPNKGQVAVQSVSMDDLLSTHLPPDSSVYILKVDVQGHEASVFSGLTLPGVRPIRYILFEYWVDALDQANGVPMGSCSSVQDVLIPFVEAGYELFDLSIVNHSKAGNRVKRKFVQSFFRPVNLLAHCQWFADRGKQDRADPTSGGDGPYNMGYWTDILAVYQGEDFLPAEHGDWNIPGEFPHVSTDYRVLQDVCTECKMRKRKGERESR